jgi:TonB family protein
MQHAPTLTACSLLLAIPAAFAPAFAKPPAQDLPEARPAPLYNPVSRCPRVRIADEGTIAVVAFLVGSTGVPSQASIQKSSQSKDLDAAALECVMKLRFSPAVRAGEGTPMDSWQQLGWRWAQTPQADGAGAAPTATSAAAAAPAAPAAAPAAVAAGAAAGGAALAGAATSSAAAGVSGATPSAVRPVELRVCADQAGRLSQEPTIIHSSGDPGLDQAAVRIAKSGSGNYRPTETLAGKPASGCAQLSIRFE